MKPNRYIKAMEIGLDHEKVGISYLDLLLKLEEAQGEPFIKSAYITFYYWFVENFTTENTDLLNMGDLKRNIHLYFAYRSKSDLGLPRKKKLQEIEATLNAKWFLKGTASKQYIDYVEYKSARKSSFWATVLASVSILIAAGSFYFTYQATQETPKPPYDVKVIEDSAQQKELEQLKEELYKAQMILEAYESDSIN